MDRTWINAAKKLVYRDPVPFLRALRLLEPRVANSRLPDKVKALRTNDLRDWRELRQAAIFCYGMGQRIGKTVYLGRGESHDYDFVASWVDGEVQHFAPVQLKEAVPHTLNPAASLAAVIASLTKYADSEDLTVAIYLNRAVHFEPQRVVAPRLRIGELWVFGSVSDDQSQWALWGDLLTDPEGTRFAYPA